MTEELYYPNGKVFNMTPAREEFLGEIQSKYPTQTQFTRDEILGLDCVDNMPGWITCGRHEFKQGNSYNFTTLLNPGTRPALKVVPTPVAVPAVTNVLDDDVKLVPAQMSNFVPFGNYTDVKKVIESEMFFPVFITGLSGNGKTLMVEQICAKLKREMFRVNITVETDEDDLIGGHTLVDGNLEYREGPVLKAMRKGAVLLLDEVDLGGNKLMCLQSILEGKGYLIKKTGEFVFPAPGFNIIATANTKGQGNDDGKFVGTQIMNEAMLERFAVTFEQQYPSIAIEKRILKSEVADTNFVDKLADWADVIRRTYNDGAIDEVISTRRLVHIARAFNMFGQDRMKAIEVCLNRFDAETKESFLDLYTKVDEGIITDAEVSTEESYENE